MGHEGSCQPTSPRLPSARAPSRDRARRSTAHVMAQNPRRASNLRVQWRSIDRHRPRIAGDHRRAPDRRTPRRREGMGKRGRASRSGRPPASRRSQFSSGSGRPFRMMTSRSRVSSGDSAPSRASRSARPSRAALDVAHAHAPRARRSSIVASGRRRATRKSAAATRSSTAHSRPAWRHARTGCSTRSPSMEIAADSLV